MKENQGWREAYNKIIFEQVDINEETIPNFIQQEINKAVLEALQKRDEEILELVRKHVIPETIFATVKAYPTENETLAWDECAVTAKENLNDLRRHLLTLTTK